MSLERCVDAYQATNATAEMVQQTFAEDRRLEDNMGERRISEGPVVISDQSGLVESKPIQLELNIPVPVAEAVSQSPVLAQ